MRSNIFRRAFPKFPNRIKDRNNIFVIFDIRVRIGYINIFLIIRAFIVREMDENDERGVTDFWTIKVVSKIEKEDRKRK